MFKENETHHITMVGVSTSDFVPQGDTISTEALVNILVKKGLCTVEEIFAEEGRIRDKNKQVNQEPCILKQPVQKSRRKRHHQSKIKRLFSKRRWTRRIGSAIFGWKWKKVKRTSKNEADSISS